MHPNKTLGVLNICDDWHDDWGNGYDTRVLKVERCDDVSSPVSILVEESG